MLGLQSTFICYKGSNSAFFSCTSNTLIVFFSIFIKKNTVPEEAPVVTTIERLNPESTAFQINWNFTDDIEMFNSYEILGYQLNLTALYPDVNSISSLEYWTESTLPYHIIPPELEAYRIFNVTLAAYNVAGIGVAQNFCLSTPTSCKL